MMAMSLEFSQRGFLVSLTDQMLLLAYFSRFIQTLNCDSLFDLLHLPFLHIFILVEMFRQPKQHCFKRCCGNCWYLQLDLATGFSGWHSDDFNEFRSELIKVSCLLFFPSEIQSIAVLRCCAISFADWSLFFRFLNDWTFFIFTATFLQLEEKFRIFCQFSKHNTVCLMCLSKSKQPCSIIYASCWWD